MVAFRLDHRLQGRIDPQDVIQEAYLEASEHRSEFFQNPSMPFYLWLRGIVGNKLLELHRFHLGTKMRDAGREVSLYRGTCRKQAPPRWPPSSWGMRPGPARRLSGRRSRSISRRPSMSWTRLDREVIALRHFEQLSSGRGCACAEIKEKAAGMRYLRALKQPQRHPGLPARGAEGAATMSEADSGLELLNELAYEFADRFRRGERPSLTEYTDMYPELAAEIRDLFPALVVIEQFGSVAGPQTGQHAGPRPPKAPCPRQLGEYRILRELGRGGMGIVYEAVQESLGRHVALKVLPFQSLADANQLERFRREAQAAARLHHTNIVPVFGVGEHDGVHYFAMQFIQGQPLDSVLTS